MSVTDDCITATITRFIKWNILIRFILCYIIIFNIIMNRLFLLESYEIMFLERVFLPSLGLLPDVVQFVVRPGKRTLMLDCIVDMACHLLRCCFFYQWYSPYVWVIAVSHHFWYRTCHHLNSSQVLLTTRIGTAVLLQ